MIQEELFDEFTVTASAPGSGAYDMSGSQLDMVASFNSYAVPGYLPYLIQAYQEVYGDLYDSIQQIYVEPYDMTLPPLLDGSVGMWDVNTAMPSVPRDIIQPDYAEAFFSDTTHPAYLALKDNDVYRWVPQAPVLFNYCRMDEEVSYLNTITASEYMINAGAPHIEVIERDSTIGHFQCAQPTILFSKLWFDTMADFCSSHVGVQERAASSFNIYPNPVSSGSVTFSNSEAILVSVMDVQGKQHIRAERVNPNQALDVSKLGPGLFLVVIQQGNDQIVRKLVVQ